jgi:hypothetical protein
MDLIVVGQAKEFLGVPPSEEDNYVDWIKFVSHEE